jgi:hypothetical protein
MPEAEGMTLGGNISLVGFEILDNAELVIVKKIVGTYIKKMSEIADYKEMRLSLKQHPHGKSFNHEISGFALFSEGRFSTNVTERNLFTAVSAACEKIFNEISHVRKKEQRHDKKTFK